MPRPKLDDSRDSDKGGKAGALSLSPLLVGLVGFAVEDFLFPGEPGNILLKVYEENRLEARLSSGSERCRAARVPRVAGAISLSASDGIGGVV
jgi:hypothetical protein